MSDYRQRRLEELADLLAAAGLDDALNILHELHPQHVSLPLHVKRRVADRAAQAPLRFA